MSERIFAVIGHPIGHTMSPFIHKRLFGLAGENGDYSIIDVVPDELPVKIKMLDELCGYNITIPNKQVIIPYLDRLDEKAAMYGSVNTVKNGSVREGFTMVRRLCINLLNYRIAGTESIYLAPAQVSP